MYELKHQTRAGSSPQGRPALYLSGHPAALQDCRGRLTHTLLQALDCAVFYEDAPGDGTAPLSAEKAELLGQMDLLVFAVDRAFLEQTCPAAAAEWAFALERHIPVLPLMLERELRVDFNRLFGPLHTLACYSEGFPEELKDFLDNTLVGYRMAEEIRGAFDAYIFLSYRKADRGQALQLMRDIHRVDLCRDVAIWYDNFLVPGEDFHAGIDAALKKSDLFTLLVTPRLLEGDNYVRRVEYKEAREQKKRILPVEMTPTDRARLLQWYQGLPGCTDGHAFPRLSDSLQTGLRGLALRKNSSPRHSYCIGLAYLQGIDVEKDYPRALRLITEAADAGLPEAHQTLIEMYETGHGVHRDYREAADRRVALAEALSPLRPEDPAAAKDVAAQLDAFLEAVRAYEELGLHQRAAEVLARAALVYQGSGLTATLSGIFYRASLDLFTAENEREQCRFKQALFDAMVAEDRFRIYFQGKKDSRAMLPWAESADLVTELTNQKADNERTRKAGRHALALYERICTADPCPQAALALAAAWRREAQLSASLGDKRAAVAAVTAGARVLKEMTERWGEGRTPEELYRRGLLLGWAASAAGDGTTARAALESAAKAVEYLDYDTRSPRARRALCTVYQELAEVLTADGDAPGAMSYLELARMGREELLRDQKDARSMRELALTYTALVKLRLQQGDRQEAEEYNRKEQKLLRRLLRLDASPDNRFLEASARWDEARLLGLKGRQKKQQKRSREAYMLFDKLDDDIGGDAAVQRAMALIRASRRP